LQDSCENDVMKAHADVPLLDDLDRRIVAALQMDPRASWSQVGKNVGTSETTAMRRVQRLRDSGVVIVTASVDPQRCGFGQPVLLHFQASPEKKGALAEMLAMRPDVQYVALVTGRSDVVCELVSPDSRYLADVLMEQLPATGLFESSHTAVVLKRFKTSDQWSRELLEAPVFVDPAGTDEIRTAASSDVQPLDDTDVRILTALMSDGRRTYADVAGELGVGETVVGRRVQSLTSSRRLDFVAMVDPVTMGFNVEAMLHLRVELSRLDDTARAVAEMTETRYVSATSGDSDLIMDAVFRDTSAMYQWVSESLGALPGIRDVEIDIVLRSVKRAYQYPLFGARDTTGEDLSSHPVGPAWQGHHTS
jgi:DNA-binding Lrp family transcriptional regulator